MKDWEANSRNVAGRLARYEDFAVSGPYSQVWHMLMMEGLTGGGEYAAAKIELLKIKAKLAKRAAQQTRKKRRRERPMVRLFEECLASVRASATGHAIGFEETVLAETVGG